MEGPYIEIKTDRPESQPPEDSGFAEVLRRMDEDNPQLAGALHEIHRSPEKKKILTEALTLSGHDWFDLQDLKENPDAARAFGHLLSFWDMPVDSKPKSKEQRQAEAMEFVKMLK